MLLLLLLLIFNFNPSRLTVLLEEEKRQAEVAHEKAEEKAHHFKNHMSKKYTSSGSIESISEIDSDMSEINSEEESDSFIDEGNRCRRFTNNGYV